MIDSQNKFFASSEEAEILGSTIANQHRASNPGNSAWVSANAGSGKTFVLAQRVIRLLLNNVAPSKILCLTFTKAAAAEMSNRVFTQLSQWSAMDDGELEAELIKTGERQPGAKMLKTARLLFTRALESPGGLKIQTIHAFCESILHQFTLEANTSGHFEVMADHEQARLLQESRQVVMAKTLEDTRLAGALEKAMQFGSDAAIEKGLNAIISDRQDFENWMFQNQQSPEEAISSLADFMNIDIAESKDDFSRRILSGLPVGDASFREIGRVARTLDQKECKRIANLVDAYNSASSASQKLNLRIELYQTGKGEFRKNIPGVKALYDEIPWLKEQFEKEFDLIPFANDQLRNRNMLDGSLALFTLANAVLQFYGQRKRARGILDFDDLVNRAAALLARSDVRQWVQYKLDQGIDHVLVDEAQDTSAVQWQIVNAIIEEFFAGDSVRNITRTIFAVGDQKQSIYSFQGADPEKFTQQKLEIKNKANAIQLPFEDIRLPISFRSTRDVLSAVDKVFEDPANAKGLQAIDEAIIHEPVRATDPGEVLIWPMIEYQKTEKQEDWLLPIDHIREDHPTLQLAKKIAATVKGWIEKGEILPGKGRPITHGDVLVLVRKRDRFASAITRELKQAGLSVAGADRLNLATHIAVEDLLSFAKWALFPEDDLSLAEILKSPILDLDEEELFALCIDRDKQSLWQSVCLNAAKSKSEKLAGIQQQLSSLLKLAATLAPYEFFSEILSTNSGRKKFKSRLGNEVDDVLDAFMLEALNHTNNGGTGLQEFIHVLETSAPDIKRELDLQKDEIRVMTVHSAKGLEAPIIFLVDPGAPAFSTHHRSSIYKIAYNNIAPAFLWQPGKEDGSALTASIQAQLQQQAEEEYRRLLYVAMTRAEDKLVICGYANRNTRSITTWHKMVKDSLIDECEEISGGGEDGTEITAWRWIKDHPRRMNRKFEHSEQWVEPDSDELPHWVNQSDNQEAAYVPPLFPSTASPSVEANPREQDLETVNTAPLSNNPAIERGNITHQLLQFLPSVDPHFRHQRATDYIKRSLPAWPKDQQDEVREEVMAILEDESFASLFSQNSQAEVSLSGILDPQGINQPVNGQIDRIAVLDDRVIIIDYKSDRSIPSRPDQISQQYLVQLAIYRELVAQIYDNRNISCGLLWTSGPLLTEIPDDLLSERLKSYLDTQKQNKWKHANVKEDTA